MPKYHHHVHRQSLDSKLSYSVHTEIEIVQTEVRLNINVIFLVSLNVLLRRCAAILLSEVGDVVVSAVSPSSPSASFFRISRCVDLNTDDISILSQRKAVFK